MIEDLKIPPQAIDAECSVLGICMSYPDAINDARLTPEMFYKDAHRKIFKAILDIKGICDTISVTNRLRDVGELEAAGGVLYITKLTNNIISDQSLDSHVAIVKQKYLRRKYIEIGIKLQTISFDESIDLSELMEYAENSLFELSDFTQSREPEILSKCIDEVLETVNKIINKEISLVGLPSGFTELDRRTGGWQPGNLIIVAGRPSMGKTAFALALSLNCHCPVGFFSLEMSKGELSTRYLSSASGYSNVEIRAGKVDFDVLVSKSNEVALAPVYIDDTPAMGLFEMRSKSKKLILKYGVKIIIVDYLQLMSEEAGSREQEVSKVSRGLKAIAKEFNITVIAVSQLNRDCETRTDKKPKLSDLRESGAIEQDADIVAFLFRPAYYDMKSIIIGNTEFMSPGLLLVEGAKNRNGALFSLPLYHNESMTVIQDSKIEIKPQEPCTF